jgi:hypothetical protein
MRRALAALIIAAGCFAASALAQTPPTPEQIKLAADGLKQQVEMYEKHIDFLSKVLAGLLGLGSLIGLGTVVVTWVNVKQLNESAEKQIAEFKRKFPSVAGLDERIKATLEAIERKTNQLFGAWDKTGQRQLSAKDREDLHLTEISFSALELFDFSDSAERVADITKIHIAYGRFYGSQYYDDTANKPAIERAKLYFRKAIESSDILLRERAHAYLGTVSCWHFPNVEGKEKADVQTEARNNFDHACLLRPTNPRALIGRAWLKRRTETLKTALDDLNELVRAIVDKQLPESEARYFRENAYYNRACYRVVDAQPGNEAATYRSALDDLWESKIAALSESNWESWLKDFKRDCEPEGDLHALAEKHRGEMDDLKDPSKGSKSGG